MTQAYLFPQHNLDYRLSAAIREVKSLHGVQLDPVADSRTIHKYGRNSNIGTTRATISALGAGELHETYATDNVISHLSSTSGSDTGSVLVQGLTISGGVFTRVNQYVTLTGQTAVALETPLARVVGIVNAGSSDFVGTIYCFETDTLTAGVPDTPANVHGVVVLGDNQMLAGQGTTANNEYKLITGIQGNVLKGNTTRADIHFELRLQGGVFTNYFEIGMSGSGSTSAYAPADPLFIVPPNSDWRTTAIASATATEVGVYIAGYLCSVA